MQKLTNARKAVYAICFVIAVGGAVKINNLNTEVKELQSAQRFNSSYVKQEIDNKSEEVKTPPSFKIITLPNGQQVVAHLVGTPDHPAVVQNEINNNDEEFHRMEMEDRQRSIESKLDDMKSQMEFDRLSQPVH